MERSLERRELYFYSSRRVGKPEYIDINDYSLGGYGGGNILSYFCGKDEKMGL